MKMLKRIVASMLPLLLVACGGITQVPAGTATINGVSFASSGAWNQMPSAMANLGPNAVSCTADGLGLDRLIVISKVQAGKPMFRNTSKDHVMPAFDAAMLPHDLEEFVLTSLTNLDGGETRFESSGLKPAKFGEAQGVTFSIAFATATGLAMSGDVLAASHNGTFNAIIFIAAREHYYGKYRPEIERLFASATIP